jgi:hypothetical protein
MLPFPASLPFAGFTQNGNITAIMFFLKLPANAGNLVLDKNLYWE